MGFDLKAFEKTKFEQRTEDVPVPELKDFFGEDEKPVFTVRNLDAPEIAKVEMAAQSNEKMAELVKHLFAGAESEKVEAIKELAGIHSGLEPVYMEALARIKLGVVSPKIDHLTAVKIGRVAKDVFWRINKKIRELSGQGAVMGKLIASTKTKK